MRRLLLSHQFNCFSSCIFTLRDLRLISISILLPLCSRLLLLLIHDEPLPTDPFEPLSLLSLCLMSSFASITSLRGRDDAREAAVEAARDVSLLSQGTPPLTELTSLWESAPAAIPQGIAETRALRWSVRVQQEEVRSGVFSFCCIGAIFCIRLNKPRPPSKTEGKGAKVSVGGGSRDLRTENAFAVKAVELEEGKAGKWISNQ
ncbi:hypothetical protein EYF80_004280 [Liparis tanakae]|uniref:Uncharacterized protein n=1 Tax=Liparis tanakae TaxID=230148 RepID=A0A4Z2J6J3_9TELE|nr:hypothetical protein EYF80_004280 [Liparis tanakae]